jgi:hypothetical protein
MAPTVKTLSEIFNKKSRNHQDIGFRLGHQGNRSAAYMVFYQHLSPYSIISELN